MIYALFMAMGRRTVLNLLTLSLLAPGVYAQTTYYIAENGSDSNDGQSIDNPFRSLAKVNSLSLRPGDQILLRRRDTFRGTLFVRQSGSASQPIVIDAYGSGNKPIIAGSVPVSNWTNTGNNTWQATCPACGNEVTGLYRNGSVLPLGRYPNLSDSNKGYLTVASHSGKTQLTSQQGLSGNWTGGEVVVRPVQWILNRAAITGQSGNTLTVAGSGNYDISDGWGFFIQNHPATLDQTGEWCYSPASKTIRLYDALTNPNDRELSATVFAEGINLTNVSFVTIRNVEITETKSTGLLITNGSNLNISHNEVTQSGEDAVQIRGNGREVLVDNNLIENVNNNGVSIGTYQNVTFRGNTIRGVGMVAGRGKSGDGTYVGLQSAGTANTLIEKNVLDMVGYVGINFSNSTTVQHNQISNFCMTKSDGSGLYIWNGNKQAMGNIRLLSNIIYNGMGAPEGTPGGAMAANGIYLDDCTTNIEVAGNTVYNCRGLGIFLHGSSNIRLTGNTAYNNNEGQLAIMSANGCQPRDNVIRDNILVSRLPGQFNVKYESNLDDLGSYGQFENNVYARPFDDTFKILAVYNKTTGAALSLAGWQGRYGKDMSSTNSPLTYRTGNPDDYIKCIANPTGDSKKVSLDGTYRDTRNNVYTDKVSIPAFSSMVLLKDIAQSPVVLRNPENPANTTAGLDYQYYEGNWNTLPDFNNLTVAKAGAVAGPTLDVRSRDDFFGIRYKGYVSVPKDGVYTFYTNSDDGSKLFIGSTEVVNNDGGHPEQERSGSIGLKAGLHAMSIVYFEGNGGQMLTASYSGPGVGNKQPIPDAAFRRAATGSTLPTPTFTPTSPVSTLRNPENPVDARTGLVYTYYEGSWTTLPDFDALSPVRTGTTNLPTVAVRSRDINFGIRYKGYVSVPNDGDYTFYTTSDDGSKLFIGDRQVVDNDGNHGGQERSGGIGLKAGVHAMTIIYYQGGGGRSLSVSYSGPGVGKQTIPDGAYRWTTAGQPALPTLTPAAIPIAAPVAVSLRDPENPANAVVGLDYQYYEGNWNELPSFDALSPAKTGTTNALTPASVRSRDNHFGIRYRGYVSVPTDGNYTFYTSSDDGSKLYIGDRELVSNNGIHGMQERSGDVGLKAGVHAMTIVYFQGTQGQGLNVSYNGPGISKQPIPDAAFRRESTGTPTPAPTPPVSSPPATAGAGTGLRAEYVNNRYLNAPVVLSRIDAFVNVDWGNGSPAGAINSDNFSVRWTGQVEAPVSGNFVFSTNTDDGVRLWVNGVRVIDNWTDHPPITNTGSLMVLVADQRYDIRMEYYENGGGAVARLMWAYPGQDQQAIPQQRLYPAAASARIAANGSGDDTFGRADFRLVYPVPTYDEFTFVADQDVETLHVADMLGRERFRFGAVRRGQPVSFGGPLPAGSYLLRIEYADGTHHTEKLLKAGR